MERLAATLSGLRKYIGSISPMVAEAATLGFIDPTAVRLVTELKI
jgi:hypothetical protein